jgi:outer membrane lipoprotein-sorting protein
MKLLLSLLVMFVSLITYSQEFKKIAQPENCKKSLEKKLSTTQSLTAKFDESIYSAMLKEPSKAKGLIKYKAKDKIRWEHTSPKKKVILMNGDKVKLQEGGKEVNNASSNKVVAKIQGMMTKLLSGKILSDKSFEVTYFESDSQYKLILLTKGRMAKYVKSIELYFDKKNLLLLQMIMKESEKDKMVYTFSDAELNKEIQDSEFTKF